MRLSEAIRLGAMLGPQTYGPQGLCAGNAALSAVGVDYSERNDHGGTSGALSAQWPWLRDHVECPVCGERSRAESVVIFHLNDDHKWARERIADWASTIEPQEQAQSVESSAPVSVEV